MDTWQFNRASLGFGSSFEQPRPEDFPDKFFKNAAIEYVLRNTTDYVRSVINSIQLQNQHRFVVVDVKVHDIEVNKYPCIPGWHCDTVIDPRHPTTPENHNIFVTGHASLTEFIGQPITLMLDLQGNPLLSSFRRQIDDLKPAITKIPSCQVVKYGRYDFHRGSIGLANEKRLLIRVSETDITAPNNKLQQFGTF